MDFGYPTFKDLLVRFKNRPFLNFFHRFSILIREVQLFFKVDLYENLIFFQKDMNDFEGERLEKKMKKEKKKFT